MVQCERLLNFSSVDLKLRLLNIKLSTTDMGMTIDDETCYLYEGHPFSKDCSDIPALEYVVPQLPFHLKSPDI
ncbi:hypothetical protein TNCV_2335161 [Trichonephila clavipes]|uniref:Uncharacterized protein n=1 Tax=Trichonephila clavipes TaxID=2585209 RepID=A0A8X6VCG4_TRICX|nr:hypothetical protein TNCV_2335161 [Trichonephila clavipes]